MIARGLWMLTSACLSTSAIYFAAGSSRSPSTRPGGDAGEIYLSAAAIVAGNETRNVMAPAESNLEYKEYPPFPAKWREMEAEDYPANATARALAHQCRLLDRATWPAVETSRWRFLGRCRALSNELADAALFEHLRGDDAAAVETLRDQLHLAEMVKCPRHKQWIPYLVGIGIRAQAMQRLMVITSSVALTNDPLDERGLQLPAARDLISNLLNHPDPKTEAPGFFTASSPTTAPVDQRNLEKTIETATKAYTECDLAAMSLACHLYRFDHGNWPTDAGDLKDYLPAIPVDPSGDGKQTIGYELIEHGLPDGSGRPVVFSRFDSHDGLVPWTTEPKYSFYSGDGSNNSFSVQKHRGQFRDVAGWSPLK